MTRLEEVREYSRKCVSGEIISGKKHRWACERFLRDLDRVGQPDFPYFWDEKAADDIVAWFEMLKHSKGALAGEPIRLTDWQMFRECQIYGWKHRETGRRRFKKAFTEVARKNAKSQMEAGEALYEISVMATKNREVYEAYTAGTKRDQSRIVFEECDLMTKGTLLRTKFNFRRDRIEHIKTGSFIKPLSKQDGKTGDGTNGALYILDEYHQHQTTEFYDLALGSNDGRSGSDLSLLYPGV